MRRKNTIRAVLAGAALAVGGLGFAAASPAHAGNLCNNEALPGDAWVQIGTTAGAGVDTGTTGLTYVPVACVNLFGVDYGAGAGATVTRTPSGATIQPYLCNATACAPFLISIGT